MNDWQKEVEEKCNHLPNYCGYSQKLRRRIKSGKQLPNTSCIRIYVTEKIKEKYLYPMHIIPKHIDGVDTDVVEIGHLEAPPRGMEREVKDKSKKERFRPTIYGVSIGNLRITAGTNGWAFTKNCEFFHGSNAHVFTDGDPSRNPNEIKEKRIVQPGPHDGGQIDDQVAEYYWHKKIYALNRNTCPLTKGLTTVYNFLSEKLKRKTRLEPVTRKVNHIDFAVAKPMSEWLLKLYDFNNRDRKFVGLIFAGSPNIGVICKAKYIEAEGFQPYGRDSTEILTGDKVEKSSRTSCHDILKVLDDSATVSSIFYGSFVSAPFRDVILTNNKNGKQIQGGDSGSSVWR